MVNDSEQEWERSYSTDRRSTSLASDVQACVHLASGEEKVTPSSMPHSELPRLMRKYPFSPQYGFHELATFWAGGSE